MTQQPVELRIGATAQAPTGAVSSSEPTLAEDLLLLLFQPNAGLHGTGVNNPAAKEDGIMRSTSTRFRPQGRVLGSERKKRRAAGRVEPGDGHVLQRYRWWQPFWRSLFHLHLISEGGAPETWSIDVRHGGDSNGEVRAQLYRDGANHAQSKLPAAFAIPGGTIEVVAGSHGLRRAHYVTKDGAERQLVPDPASGEGQRARLERTRPALSRAIGLASVSVLVVALVLGTPLIIEQITRIPPIADKIGTFVSPFHFSFWANLSLVLATLVASTERALRLRYNWLLDIGYFGG